VTARTKPATGGYSELARTWQARRAKTEMRLIPHHATCPACGSTDVRTEAIELAEGITEDAYVCEHCGTAWPLACVCEWS
jgi:transposase-like protein